MTNRLVRHQAKEFAGIFYDENRTARFRRMWPSQREYVRINWPHFHDLAVKALTHMLMQPGVRQDHKDTIYEALIDNRVKSDLTPGALRPLQATLEPREKDDNKIIDSTPEMTQHEGM